MPISFNNPSQPGPNDNLLQSLNDLANATRTGTEGISDNVSSMARAVKSIMDETAKNLTDAEIVGNLQELQAELAKGAKARANVIERCTQQAAIAKNLASQSYQNILDFFPDLKKTFESKSFLPQQASLSRERIAGHLEQVSRVQSMVQGEDFTGLLGGHGVTKNIGASLMARDMEGEVFKASQAMQKLAAEEAKGVLLEGEKWPRNASP